MFQGHRLLGIFQVGDAPVREERQDRLVDASKEPLLQGNADQGRDDTLGTRANDVLLFRTEGMDIGIDDQITVADDLHAMDGIVLLLDLCQQEGQHGRIYALLLRCGRPPAAGGPVALGGSNDQHPPSAPLEVVLAVLAGERFHGSLAGTMGGTDLPDAELAERVDDVLHHHRVGVGQMKATHHEGDLSAHEALCLADHAQNAGMGAASDDDRSLGGLGDQRLFGGAAAQLAGGVQAREDLDRIQHLDHLGAGADPSGERLGEGDRDVDGGLDAGAQQETQPSRMVAVDVREDHGVDVLGIEAQLGHVVEQGRAARACVKQDRVLSILDPGRKAPLGRQALSISSIVVDDGNAHLAGRLGGSVRGRGHRGRRRLCCGRGSRDRHFCGQGRQGRGRGSSGRHGCRGRRGCRQGGLFHQHSRGNGRSAPCQKRKQHDQGGCPVQLLHFVPLSSMLRQTAFIGHRMRCGLPPTSASRKASDERSTLWNNASQAPNVQWREVQHWPPDQVRNQPDVQERNRPIGRCIARVVVIH